MWREWFTLTLVVWSLNALALAFGASLGLRGLFEPHWAARRVRLKADEQGGGLAEFRAAFGGLLLAAHAAALFFTIKWIINAESVVGIFAAGAAAALSAAWIGAAGGRVLSMLRDNTRTRFNLTRAAVELVLGVLIGAPWALWNFQIPS